MLSLKAVFLNNPLYSVICKLFYGLHKVVLCVGIQSIIFNYNPFWMLCQTKVWTPCHLNISTTSFRKKRMENTETKSNILIYNLMLRTLLRRCHRLCNKAESAIRFGERACAGGLLLQSIYKI